MRNGECTFHLLLQFQTLNAHSTCCCTFHLHIPNAECTFQAVVAHSTFGMHIPLVAHSTFQMLNAHSQPQALPLMAVVPLVHLLWCIFSGASLLMDVVPIGLAGPLEIAAPESGGAKRKRLNELPQTFLVVSLPRPTNAVVHGLFTFDNVGVFGTHASEEEHQQLAALRAAPGEAVVWRISQSSAVELTQALSPDELAKNLCRLLVAKPSPTAVAVLHASVGPDQLQCPARLVRIWRLPQKALAPKPGASTLVTRSTQRRAVGVEPPTAELQRPGRDAEDGATLVKRQKSATLEMACNTHALERGFNRYEFSAQATFLALRLMHRLKSAYVSLEEVVSLGVQLALSPAGAAEVCQAIASGAIQVPKRSTLMKARQKLDTLQM